MPARTQSKIRRDINRLNDLVQQHKGQQPALLAIEPSVSGAAKKVNEKWQAFQIAALAGEKERSERDAALLPVVAWVQRWRPVVLLIVPGASASIAQLPARATTPDDTLRLVQDLKTLIEQDPAAASFRSAALAELGTGADTAKKELSEAVAALPVEQQAREEFSKATVEANAVLVRGTEVVRAIFGPTSVQYKQFIASSPREDAEDAADAATGESAAPTSTPGTPPTTPS